MRAAALLTAAIAAVFICGCETAARTYTPSGPLGSTTLFEHEVWNNKKTLGHCAGFDHKERGISTRLGERR